MIREFGGHRARQHRRELIGGGQENREMVSKLVHHPHPTAVERTPVMAAIHGSVRRIQHRGRDGSGQLVRHDRESEYKIHAQPVSLRGSRVRIHEGTDSWEPVRVVAADAVQTPAHGRDS